MQKLYFQKKKRKKSQKPPSQTTNKTRMQKFKETNVIAYQVVTTMQAITVVVV